MNILESIMESNGNIKWWVKLILFLLVLRILNTIYNYVYRIRQHDRINKIKQDMKVIGLGTNNQNMSELNVPEINELDILYEMQVFFIGIKNKMIQSIFS